MNKVEAIVSYLDADTITQIISDIESLRKTGSISSCVYRDVATEVYEAFGGGITYNQCMSLVESEAYRAALANARAAIEQTVRACADAADMAYDAHCDYPGDYVVEQMGYGKEEGVVAWRCKTS